MIESEIATVPLGLRNDTVTSHPGYNAWRDYVFNFTEHKNRRLDRG